MCAIYYVDPTSGSDAGAGTSGDPWKTLNGHSYADGDEFRIAKSPAPTTYSSGLDFTNNSPTFNRNAGNADDLSLQLAVGDLIEITGEESWGTNRPKQYYIITARTVSTLTIAESYLGSTGTNKTVTRTTPHTLGATTMYNLQTASRNITISGGWDLSGPTQDSSISFIYNSSGSDAIGASTNNNSAFTISQIGIIKSGSSMSWRLDKDSTFTNFYAFHISAGSSPITFQTSSAATAEAEVTFTTCLLSAPNLGFSSRKMKIVNSALLYNTTTGNNSLFSRYVVLSNCLIASRSGPTANLIVIRAGLYNCDFKAPGGAGPFYYGFHNRGGVIHLFNCSFKTFGGVDVTANLPVKNIVDATYGRDYSHISYQNYQSDSFISCNAISKETARIRLNSSIERTAGKPSVAFTLLAAQTNIFNSLSPLQRIKFAVNASTQYTVTVYCRKNTSYGSNNRPKIRVYYDQDTVADAYVETTMADTTDTWSAVTAQFTPAAAGAAELDFMCFYNAAGAIAYFADWSVA